jgi:hypothetical protein
MIFFTPISSTKHFSTQHTGTSASEIWRDKRCGLWWDRDPLYSCRWALDSPFSVSWNSPKVSNFQFLQWWDSPKFSKISFRFIKLNYYKCRWWKWPYKQGIIVLNFQPALTSLNLNLSQETNKNLCSIFILMTFMN